MTPSEADEQGITERTTGGTEMEQRRINRIRTQQRKQEREIKQQPFVIAQQRWQTQIEAGRVQTWGDW